MGDNAVSGAAHDDLLSLNKPFFISVEAFGFVQLYCCLEKRCMRVGTGRASPVSVLWTATLAGSRSAIETAQVLGNSLTKSLSFLLCSSVRVPPRLSL